MQNEKLRDAIHDYIEDQFPDEKDKILLADGLEEAFLGVSDSFNGVHVAIYDINTIISNFVRDGMSDEDAWEWFEYNIRGAFMGEYTPIFLRRFDRFHYDSHPQFDPKLWLVNNDEEL
jgi:hypothetical protein